MKTILLLVLLLFLLCIFLIKLLRKQPIPPILIGGNIFRLGRSVNLNTLHFSESVAYNNMLTFNETKDKILELDGIYEKDEFIDKHMKQIVHKIHPFEDMKITIYFDIIERSVPITNAFMKMIEFLHLIPKPTNFTMFDIASAPGMFIIAAHHILKDKLQAVHDCL